MDDKFYIEKLDNEFHPNDPHAPQRKGHNFEQAAERLRQIMQEMTDNDR